MPKLLFDNNISHRVIARIEDIFPQSSHVMLENIDNASDQKVWIFARSHGYTVVTKDSDFNDMAIHKGIPPKIIWIKIGNCKVADIEKLLRKHQDTIKNFIDDDINAILEI